MHAVVRYGLWLKNEDGGSSFGFEDMPEVRLALESHLDPRADASAAVRSVYGQWFPSIESLDHEWAIRHVESIFPAAADAAALFRAAWDAYVTLWSRTTTFSPYSPRPNDHAIGLLDPQSTDESDHNAETRLAEHLMVFVGRGKIEADSESLCAKFFARAPGRLRGRALNFVGWSLSQADVLPGEVLVRLVRLWEGRMAALEGQSDIAEHGLPAFGSRFASGNWIRRGRAMLRRVVAVTPLVERHEKVMKQLARAGAERPLRKRLMSPR